MLDLRAVLDTRGELDAEGDAEDDRDPPRRPLPGVGDVLTDRRVLADVEMLTVGEAVADVDFELTGSAEATADLVAVSTTLAERTGDLLFIDEVLPVTLAVNDDETLALAVLVHVIDGVDVLRAERVTDAMPDIDAVLFGLLLTLVLEVEENETKGLRESLGVVEGEGVVDEQVETDFVKALVGDCFEVVVCETLLRAEDDTLAELDELAEPSRRVVGLTFAERDDDAVAETEFDAVVDPVDEAVMDEDAVNEDIDVADRLFRVERDGTKVGGKVFEVLEEDVADLVAVFVVVLVGVPETEMLSLIVFEVAGDVEGVFVALLLPVVEELLDILRLMRALLDVIEEGEDELVADGDRELRELFVLVTVADGECVCTVLALVDFEARTVNDGLCDEDGHAVIDTDTDGDLEVRGLCVVDVVAIVDREVNIVRDGIGELEELLQGEKGGGGYA